MNFLLFCRRIGVSAFSGLWRNRFSLLVFLTGISLLLFLLHALSFASLFSQFLVNHFEKKADIPVFIQREASEYRIETFQQELARKKKSGDIADYSEISKEEAFADFRKRFPEETTFLDQYDIDNPFSTLFSIVPASSPDPSFSLESWLFSDEWHDVIDGDALQKSEDIRTQVQNFLHLTSFSETTLLLFRFIFSGVLFALLFLFVLLHIRGNRQEIQIMRLVGAKISFLQAPFLLQALLLSFFSAVFGTIFFLWALEGVHFLLLQMSLQLGIGENGSVSEFFHEKNTFSRMLSLNILLLFLISIISAWFAVWRALREKLFLQQTPS